MTNFTPRNATEAMRYAKTWERATRLVSEGYTFTQDADSGVVSVCKPGRLAASYLIGVWEAGECDCPDFQKHGQYCKHTLCWQEVQADEARCEAYEAEEAERVNAECAGGCDAEYWER